MSFVFLSFKLFFRKKSTAATVLALTLLVAIVASMYAVVNFIGSQTSAIGQLARVGNRYLVLSENRASLSDSCISRETEGALSFEIVENFFAQKIFRAKLQTDLSNFTVTIRGVENLTAYLKTQSVSVNGTTAKNMDEANVGMLLANIASIGKNDYVTVSVGNVSLYIQIVGVTRAQTQLDSELIVPIETADYLTGNRVLSFIEFSFKENIDRQQALSQISGSLPTDGKVVKVQQTGLFLEQSTGETLNFLTVWSITVFVLVAAASYVVSTRLIVESGYELTMLRAIGAKRLKVSSVIFTYNVLAAVAGSVLGIALGIVGTQVVSSVLRVWQNIPVVPFLELAQFGQILALSLLFSALGCVYPTLRLCKENFKVVL
ncbi:MAG: FtsX-like permease family protein [Candidatus Bathyarchaeota archaeon]|nr:FtsX-like permease family protein [Candidatus Bathyarchaeota archaeon]